MSGTSLDGLDLAFCEFGKPGGQWLYTIIRAETIPYSEEWTQRLSSAENGTALEFVETDWAFGHHCGQLARNFLDRHNLMPDLIASHGHTIFHQPSRGLTSQIGNGAAIAAETGLPVCCDFRTLDVALGGEGAPLVPIGDKLLFGHMDFCLNIGGFANISFDQNGKRIAFDVCPANIILNGLARQMGHPYDPDGRIARSGRIDAALLEKLNTLGFYGQPPPKSLGKEWVLENIVPLLENETLYPADQLSTFTEHIAMQIGRAVNGSKAQNMMITGGGAHNEYLTERIKLHAVPGILIPEKTTIDYKEALVFAFLGMLRMRGEINTLASVTGAASDTAGGCIYG